MSLEDYRQRIKLVRSFKQIELSSIIPVITVTGINFFGCHIPQQLILCSLLYSLV